MSFEKFFSRILLWNFTIFFVCTDYSYSDFHFSRICEFERTRVRFFFLIALLVVLLHSPDISFSYSVLLGGRRTLSLFALKEFLLSRSFYVLNRVRLRRIVMNHNFKLKSSETSVTNDAELLNYALKSARENVVGHEEGEPLFIMLLLASLLLVIRSQRCRTTRCPRAHLSFPIFNARGACRENVDELSRTLRPFAF